MISGYQLLWIAEQLSDNTAFWQWCWSPPVSSMCVVMAALSVLYFCCLQKLHKRTDMSNFFWWMKFVFVCLPTKPLPCLCSEFSQIRWLGSKLHAALHHGVKTIGVDARLCDQMLFAAPPTFLNFERVQIAPRNPQATELRWPYCRCSGAVPCHCVYVCLSSLNKAQKDCNCYLRWAISH